MTVQVLFYTQRCIIQKLAANAAHTPRSEQGKTSPARYYQINCQAILLTARFKREIFLEAVFL